MTTQGRILVLAGAVAAAAGAAMLAGWHAGATALISLNGSWAPVAYDTGAGFLACGLGLLAVGAGWRRAGLPAGLLVAGWALLALVRHASGAPLRIGIEPQVHTDPNVALSFAMLGLALVWMGGAPAAARRLPVHALLGSIAGSFGLAALLAAFTGVGALPVGADTSIAPWAAVVFAFVGLSLGAAEWRRSPSASSILAGAGVFAAAFYVGDALGSVEGIHVEQSVELAAVRLRDGIGAEVDSRLLALIRMARRWEVRGSPSKLEWETDAALYLRDLPGCRALAWAGPAGELRWKAPEAGNEMDLLNLAADPRLQAAFQAAGAERRSTLSQPVPLSTGGHGFLIFVPLFPKGEFQGLVAGLFSFTEMVEPVLKKTAAEEFSLSLSQSGRSVYQRGEPGSGRWAKGFRIDLLEAGWIGQIWPQPSWLRAHRSVLPAIIRGLGLLVAILVSLALHFAQTARLRALDSEAARRQAEHEISERKQAQEEVARARDELEVRVGERTAELAAANEELKAEIAVRRRTEETLRASEERYRSLFDNATDLLYIHDLQGQFTAINKAAERLTGYTREEALRMNLAQIVAPEQVATAREMIARNLAGDAGTTYELEILTRDQNRIPVEVSTHLLFRDGQPSGVLSIAREITERKRIEEHLRQSQKIEAIGRLAGGVAHDFNNLLTIIGAYSHMLLSDLPSGHRALDYAREILAAADRASALTDRLLAFSRRQVAQPRIIDLNELLRNMGTMLHRVIGEDIELVTVLAPGLGRINADPNQIEQVVMNLALNSRDALPNGGTLVIETANLEGFSLGGPDSPRGPWVMLTVRDNGQGMDGETQSHLFEPFFTTKGPGKGTGLGLSIVYGIVKQSAGEIMVRSELGKGTTFTIYFPRADMREAVARPPEVSTAPPTGAETILLVEDEAGVRKLVHHMLAQQGYAVLEASNGPETLDLINHHPGSIDMLLTDVVMPQMSGRELAERLQRNRPGLKVLFMTGYTEDAVVRHGISTAGVAFLQKPFQSEALARKVREVLDS